MEKTNLEYCGGSVCPCVLFVYRLTRVVQKVGGVNRLLLAVAELRPCIVRHCNVFKYLNTQVFK